VHASRKHAQHARSVRGIGGLAEKLAIDDNYGVGSEHNVVRTLMCNRKRLLTRQAFGTGFRSLSGQRIFRDVRGLHLECDSGAAQQFLATRRRGGEH
jgi:hypothetical protein